MGKLWDRYVAAHKKAVNALGLEQDTRTLGQVVRGAPADFRKIYAEEQAKAERRRTEREEKRVTKAAAKASARPAGPESLNFTYRNTDEVETDHLLIQWQEQTRSINGLDAESGKQMRFAKSRITFWFDDSWQQLSDYDPPAVEGLQASG